MTTLGRSAAQSRCPATNPAAALSARRPGRSQCRPLPLVTPAPTPLPSGPRSPRGAAPPSCARVSGARARAPFTQARAGGSGARTRSGPGGCSTGRLLPVLGAARHASPPRQQGLRRSPGRGSRNRPRGRAAGQPAPSQARGARTHARRTHTHTHTHARRTRAQRVHGHVQTRAHAHDEGRAGWAGGRFSPSCSRSSLDSLLGRAVQFLVAASDCPGVT